MIEVAFQGTFEAQRVLRKHSKEHISKIQAENKKTYNLRRKEPKSYEVRNLVAIKGSQFGPHLKLKPKFLDPYRITKVKRGDTYDVIKERSHKGPYCSTAFAEFLKPRTNCLEY